jgi:hypothetical protein
MSRLNVLLVLVGLLLGAVVATHLPLRAQGGGQASDDRTSGGPRPAAVSVQDALLLPYHFRFAQPTPLAEVAQRLGQDLALPVVLDLAALERMEVKPDDTVRLDLKGVRLKTGLKLLLDQAGLTYRVVPEDNLLILTDKEGSDDPLERLSAEVREVHRDVHDLQDAVDDLQDLLGVGSGEEGRVRKPTIIEEMPEHAEPKAEEGAAPAPAPRAPEANPRPSVGPHPRPRTRL